jgi:hypothetical protein
VNTLVFVIIALLLAQPRAVAAVMKTYIGGTGSWTDGSKWDPPGQPDIGDDVTISSGSVSLGVDTAIATLTQSGGTLTGSGTLTVTGLVTWTSGTMSGSGTTVATAGMALGGSSKTLDQRTVVLSGGTAAMNANVSAIIMQNGATFTNQATFELSNDGGLTNNQGFFDDGSGGSVFNNQGTLRKLAAGNSGTSRFSGVAMNNSGGVEVQAGTLVLGGGGTHSGATFTAIAPSVLDFGGGTHMLDAACTVTGTGTAAFGGGTTTHLGAYTVSGTTRVSGGDVIFSGPVSTLGDLEISSGTADFSGSVTQISLGSLAQSGGTLSGANTLIVSGPASWTSGTMGGSGTIVLMAGLALGGTSKTLNQRTLVLSGGTAAMNASVSFISMRNGATFTNQGIFELSNDGGLTNNQGFFDGGSGGGAFNNHGTLRKLATGNSGTSRFGGVAMTNTGVVEAQAGALSFSGGFTQTAGTTRLGGGTLISTTTLTINGGTLEGVGTIEGDVSSSGHVGPGLSAGALQIAGTYTQTVAGALGIEIGGPANTQFDRLDVSGPATLAGTLAVSFIGGFAPTLGQSFEVMTFASRSGTISTVTGTGIGGSLTLVPIHGATNLTLQVVSAPGTPTSTSASTPTMTSGAPSASVTALPTATASVLPSRTATATLGASITPTPTETPTPTDTPSRCVGDCDGNGTVQIQELILAINIAVRGLSVENCEAIDVNLDGAASVDELVAAVLRTLNGCP